MNFHNSAGPVLVVGSAGLDTLARAGGELPLGSSTAGWIRRAYGGVARNIADNLARLDVPAVLVTAVGADEYGRSLLSHAASLGINVEHVFTVDDEGVATGGYVAVFNEDGTLRVAVDQMAPVSAITPRFLRELRPLFR